MGKRVDIYRISRQYCVFPTEKMILLVMVLHRQERESIRISDDIKVSTAAPVNHAKPDIFSESFKQFYGSRY